jgi:hypothetical protein
LFDALRKTVVNAFIVFHLVIITAWSLPPPQQGNKRPFIVYLSQKYEDTRERITNNRVVSWYMIFMGLWQGWDMFSPNPLSLNLDVEADITYRNGQVVNYIFPRMNELGLFQRYQKERYRKWRERVRVDDYRSIWHDAALWVARQHYTDVNNPPVHVSLTRYWMQLPPPQAGQYQPWQAYYERTSHYQYYDLNIEPGDL